MQESNSAIAQLRKVKTILVFFFLTVLVTTASCSSSKINLTNPVPVAVGAGKSNALLYFDGYGYEYGDIILLDTEKTPALGDVILYDWTLNKSDFNGFGPRYQLARVIGLPGDEVTFESWSYNANSYNVTLTGQEHNPPTKYVIWGNETFIDVSGLTLKLPDEEYLGDRMIGREGRQEIGKTESIGYNRFTVKKDAINGIVVKKIGHQNIPRVIY
jgi:hypothetical protein